MKLNVKFVPELIPGSCEGCCFDRMGRPCLRPVVYEDYNCTWRKTIFVEDTMTNKKEEAVKAVNDAKLLLEKATKALEDCDKLETYPVSENTPIGKDYSILLNANKQKLIIDCGLYSVVNSQTGYYEDHTKEYVWIPCRYDDLIPGAIAYRSEVDSLIFDKPSRACIIEKNRYFYKSHVSDSVVGDTSMWGYWYKLVKKIDL